GHLVEIGATGGSRRALGLVLGAGLLFRLALVAAPPALSDDIHRYLWDGRVQAAGVNPYLHAPADPALDAIATPSRGSINNPTLVTSSPPAAQIVFLAVARLGGGITAMKLLLSLFDMGTVLAIAGILKHRGKDPALVVLYAWSPLALLEVSWSGHSDALGV